jgi:hypothetical protein
MSCQQLADRWMHATWVQNPVTRSAFLLLCEEDSLSTYSDTVSRDYSREIWAGRGGAGRERNLSGGKVVCHNMFHNKNSKILTFYYMVLLILFYYVTIDFIKEKQEDMPHQYKKVETKVNLNYTLMIFLYLNDKKELHGLSPRANYTDRATAACRRSDCQLFRIKGATWSAGWILTAVFSVF